MSVRCVFTVNGADGAPADLVADVNALTHQALWRHATSTLSGVPRHNVSVAVEGGARLVPTSPQLVAVPAKHLLRLETPAPLEMVKQQDDGMTPETSDSAAAEEPAQVPPPSPPKATSATAAAAVEEHSVPFAVTVTVRRLRSSALPVDRSSLLPAFGTATGKIKGCCRCGVAPKHVLDCGHLACGACVVEPADADAFPECPLCGFWTVPPSDFASGAGRKAVATLPNNAAEAVELCNRTTHCAVCKERPAVGRCNVELLSMCQPCFDEHLPSGPLRASHKLLAPDATEGDGAAVLCANPEHRNLPVKYLCVDHGVLGCHMCLRETMLHEKCTVITADGDLAGIAADLRVARESEASKVITVASSQVRLAWHQHDALEKSYDALAATIKERAAAYEAAIAEQRDAALAKLRTLYDESRNRWERRIVGLDALRGRAAVVCAVLDGHRDLAPSLLLHAEANGHLGLLKPERGVLDLSVEVINELNVQAPATLPALFAVTADAPTTADGHKRRGGELTKVRTAQQSVSDIAKQWTTRNAPAAAVPAVVPAVTATTEKRQQRALAVEPLVQVLHPDDTAARATLDLATFGPLAAGPREFAVAAHPAESVVVVFSTRKTGTRVAALIGNNSNRYEIASNPTAAAIPSVNVGSKSFNPVHAVFHKGSDSYVICDQANSRVAFVPEQLVAAALGLAKPTEAPLPTVRWTPPGLLNSPVATGTDGTDPKSIIVVDAGNARFVALAADGQSIVRRLPFTFPPAKNPLSLQFGVACTVGSNPFIAVLREGAVHICNAKTWQFVSTAAFPRGLSAPLAVAAHPTASTIAAVHHTGEWSVKVVLLAADVPAPAPVAVAAAAVIPGGRQRNAAAPSKPVEPVSARSNVSASTAVSLKVGTPLTVALTGLLPKTSDASLVAVDGVSFDGPNRLILAVREMIPETSADAAGVARLQLRAARPHVLVVALSS